MYKELIKKKINKKYNISYSSKDYSKKDENWGKIINSTNKLINYIMVTKQG